MVELTHLTFEPFITSHRFAAIHFWATWNGYDAGVKAFLENRLPVEIRELIALGRMEVDPPAHQEIVRRCHIVNLPYVAFYRDGSLTGHQIGVGERTLVEHLRGLVSSAQ